jgi:hypothetical protein
MTSLVGNVHLGLCIPQIERSLISAANPKHEVSASLVNTFDLHTYCTWTLHSASNMFQIQEDISFICD